MYDGYRNETFKLRAMLFCTINEFSTYGNLSGYSVKGHRVRSSGLGIIKKGELN